MGSPLYYIMPYLKIYVSLVNTMLMILSNSQCPQNMPLPLLGRSNASLNLTIKKDYYFYDLGEPKTSYKLYEMIFLFKEIHLILDWCLAIKFFDKQLVTERLRALDEYTSILKNGKVSLNDQSYGEVKEDREQVREKIIQL